MQSLEPGPSAEYAESGSRIRPYTRSIKRLIYIHLSNRLAVSAGRRTRRQNAWPEKGSLQSSSAPQNIHTTSERVNWSRGATELSEEGFPGELRVTNPQALVQAPYRVCEGRMEDNQRFAFYGRLVHRRYATESAEGRVAGRDDRFGVGSRGEGQRRHVGQRSTSPKDCRESTCDMNALPLRARTISDS